jgi:hypothetical protein
MMKVEWDHACCLYVYDETEELLLVGRARSLDDGGSGCNA